METLSLSPSPVPSPSSQHFPSLSPTTSSPANRPLNSRSHRSHPNFSLLPPLVTSPPPRVSHSQRLTSQSEKRLSLRSSASDFFARSRPQSTVFPAFHSSLSYTLVRDFAYPLDHALHYGSPLEPHTEVTPPVSERQALLSRSREGKGSWSADAGVDRHAAFRHSGPRLPATSYGDGPPWSEDEDLLSPIVTSTKHKRSKSNLADSDRDRGRSRDRNVGGSGRTRSDAAVSLDGTEALQSVAQTVGLPSVAEDYITYGASHGGVTWQLQGEPPYISPDADPSFDDEASFASDDDPTPFSDEDGSATSRYSRDYQFTIASPDEEMCGKAVALFDFARENENELPLLEGQVLWVSYRHGQGWLVAQDPKSGESGLVPEEYVRLVRDIEGGLTRLNGGEVGEIDGSPVAVHVDTPTSGTAPPVHERSWSGTSGKGGKIGQLYTPVVSHFSTSSRDLQPYPLGNSVGGVAPGQTSPPAVGVDDSRQLQHDGRVSEKEGEGRQREGRTQQQDLTSVGEEEEEDNEGVVAKTIATSADGHDSTTL